MEILVRHLQRLPKQSRVVLQTCLYGLGAGASAVFFQLGINWLYRLGLAGLSHQSTSTFLIGSLAIIAVSSLFMGWLLNSFCGEAAGSGIRQLKLAFWKDFGTVPWRIAWVKFVAGIVSIGGGQSLGCEGPSMQLAGAVSSNLAGLGGGKPSRTGAWRRRARRRAWQQPSTPRWRPRRKRLGKKVFGLI